MTYAAALVVVSDRSAKGERGDASAEVLTERLARAGFEVVATTVIPDEMQEIVSVLKACADRAKLPLVVTTGGTGVSPRDVTPDATLQVIDRAIPGMAEAMRAASLLKTPHAMISRAVVGIRGTTLIVNLPGSPKGAVENLEVILPALPHAIDKIWGDTSDCAH
jgi:molybdenum cofactor synthesis domain-containing protein